MMSKREVIEASEYSSGVIYGEKREFPSEKSVYHLFEEQVEKTPNDIAVICDEESLTFCELNAKANCWARQLLHMGIGEGDIVIVLLDKSFDLIAGILAILKVGAIYLPLERTCPIERLNYIIHDSRAQYVLLNDKIQGINTSSARLLFTDVLNQAVGFSEENLDVKYNPERAIYVIYTSGSTGNPKGVLIRSKAFTNLLNWYNSQFEISSSDHVLLVSSVSFDLTQKNLFCTLISGGTLCLYSQAMYNPRLISELISKHSISLVNCTPSAFLPVLNSTKRKDYQKLKTIRYLFLGGEPLNINSFSHWQDSENCNGHIVNTYGPTECTDIATFFVVEKGSVADMANIPIGKAIYNVNLYVVDEKGCLICDDKEGELCIGGVGVGVGYINNDNLTSERYIVSPQISSERVYKTGDIVKRNKDGYLEYVGRVDNQIKLHGYRIEIEEIEACINQFLDVVQSVVVLHSLTTSEKVLKAYYTSASDINRDEITEYLSHKLPHYMIPAQYERISEFPLTPNGKIDRKKMKLLSL